LEAVSPTQRQRLRRAIRALAARRRGLEQSHVRLDLMALAPRRLPRHIPDAWSQDADFD
jgi:putative endonuclease